MNQIALGPIGTNVPGLFKDMQEIYSEIGDEQQSKVQIMTIDMSSDRVFNP